MRPAWGFTTTAIHGGTNPDPLGTIPIPIYQTATFQFHTVAEGAERASGDHPAFYTRWSNPNTDYVEAKMALLEGGEAALAVASGMAAVSKAALAVVRGGDHAVVPGPVYSATYELFAKLLPQYGVEATFVDPIDPENYARAMRPNTKLVYVETPANPMMTVTDIAAAAAIGRRAGATVIADNTFATPYNTRPLEWGVDVVVHSATKYIGGHHTVVGGIIVASQAFIRRAFDQLRILGGSIDPFAAWLLGIGVQTMALRVERQNHSALAVAEFLARHPKVERVHYPGLPSHPNHDVARRQMRGFGGMLAFEVKGGLEGGRQCVEHLRLMKLAVSLGGVSTLVTHAASTTHVKVPREDRLRAGITDGLIRVSVGIEDVEDLINDLDGALSHV